MNDTNVRYTIIDEMEEAGIAKREGMTIVREVNGRTYMIGISLFDITGWAEGESR